MTRHPDETDQALIPGPDQGLDRAAGAVGLRPLVLLHQIVQLDQIDLVDAEPLQRPLQAGSGLISRAVTGLGGEEELVPVGRQPRCQSKLRVAVGGRGVEVVDPELEQDVQKRVGALLRHPPERCRAEDDSAGGVPGPAELRSLDHVGTLRGLHRGGRHHCRQ